MKGKLLFSAVALILFGHIFSAPTASGDGPLQVLSRELELDTSNAVLGDIPIVPDHEVEILNRRFVPLRNCKELLDAGFTKSGLYVIQLGSQGGEFVVFCDMTLHGGGWTIIQRRRNKNLSFYRNYASYQYGFGDFAENFWLGLDKINRLTNGDAETELYIGLESHFGSSTYSLYDEFSVGDEASGYRLTIDGFNKASNAGDSMSLHDGMKFSTHDKDQDLHSASCAETFKGGWWYNSCHQSNLNGKYYDNSESYYHVPDGLSWSSWVGPKHSLKSTLIAIRPKI